jgi:hypothetical protein
MRACAHSDHLDAAPGVRVVSWPTAESGSCCRAPRTLMANPT